MLALFRSFRLPFSAWLNTKQYARSNMKAGFCSLTGKNFCEASREKTALALIRH